MRGHRDLVAWQKAMDLAKQIYLVTNVFPKHELYRLTSQLRPAAVSVPGNLAEGSARNSQREFSYFISTARGSLAVIETQIERAVFLGYISQDDSKSLIDRSALLGRLLTGLRDWSAKPQIVRDKQQKTNNKKQL